MRFTELDCDLRDATIFLDIDGTLVGDKQRTIADDALAKIRELAIDNEVYLSSNGDPFRAAAIAKQAGVQALPKLRKPFTHAAMRSITRRKRVVVIGDKFLTDGLFAKVIGAEFIKVERLREVEDDWLARFAYAVDDILWKAGPYLSLMRPHQWVKNLLVFTPLFFAGALFWPPALLASFAAFVAFSLAAGIVYIVNDRFDIERDRAHPQKKRRPLASGALSIHQAYMLIGAVMLALASITYAYPSLLIVLGAYVVLNSLYSWRLKHVAVLDVLLVAIFYLLRLAAGSAVTGIVLSPWIILCVFFAALFLIVGKRRAEFDREAKRPVLTQYSKGALDSMLAGTAALTIISYGLYTVIGRSESLLVYSTGFVAFALFRIINRQYTHPERAEQPEKILFTDPWVFASFACWGLYVFIILYLLHSAV